MAKRFLTALLLTILVAAPLTPAQIPPNPVPDVGDHEVIVKSPVPLPIELPDTTDAADPDRDGHPTTMETKAGSHPYHHESQPGSDDDGDGQINSYEDPATYDYVTAQCTGAYGYVRSGECGGYAQPANAPRLGEHVWRDAESRIWVWDSVCLPAQSGHYATCKATSNHALATTLYTGGWTGDGYGWRRIDSATRIDAYVNCGSSDPDHDEIPTLHVCRKPYTIHPDGSIQEGAPQLWMNLGDEDGVLTPGLPSLAAPMLATENKGYIVIPYGQQPLVRAVPAADASGRMAILFFLTDLPDGSSAMATLRAFDVRGNVLYDQSQDVYFDGEQWSDALVFFEAIPSEGAAKLQFTYGDVQQDVEVDEPTNLGDVPDVPCQDAASCSDPCLTWGFCEPTEPCTYLGSTPIICGPAPTYCSLPVVKNYPPCGPAPPPPGACDLAPDAPVVCKPLGPLCDAECLCRMVSSCNPECLERITDCVESPCESDPEPCDIEEPCNDPEQECTDPCTWVPALCEDKPCQGPLVDCVPSCEDTPQLCSVDCSDDIVDECVPPVCEGPVTSCVPNPCEPDPETCDIEGPCGADVSTDCVSPCEQSSSVCEFLDSCNRLADCAPTPCPTAVPICDIGLPCDDGGCLSSTTGSACLRPTCYEIEVPLTMTASAQDQNRCRTVVNRDGHASLPVAYEQNLTDQYGQPLAYIDYASMGWAGLAGVKHTCNSAYNAAGVYKAGVQWSGPQELFSQQPEILFSSILYHGASAACNGNTPGGGDYAHCEAGSSIKIWTRPDARAFVPPNGAHFRFEGKPAVYENKQPKASEECHPMAEIGQHALDAVDILSARTKQAGGAGKAGWVSSGIAFAMLGLEKFLDEYGCKLKRWSEMKAEMPDGEVIGNGVFVATKYNEAVALHYERKIIATYGVRYEECPKDGMIEFATMNRLEWSAEGSAGGLADSTEIHWEGASTEQDRPLNCKRPESP